jgi:imidazolonepropionase-like amidohydrolase
VAIDRDSGSTPDLLWLDASDELFSTDVGWFMTVKPGAEPALPTLRKIETAYIDERAAALNTRLMHPTSGVVAITNADLFDSERGVIRPKTTVLIRGERVVAVGPSDSVNVPSGATIIDATGKTVMPGMWDMHGHMQLESETSSSLMQLAQGITTVRDLASDIDVATSQRDRAQAGRIAAPHAVLAGFIEGPGKWAGPTAVLVRTEDEARQWVRRYDSLGYKQIKVYNLVHPDLIPTIAQEAHARGMRLSGHIPRGLSVPTAVELGFDEVNHAAFLFSTFYQDSLYTPTMRAYSAVATAVAPNIDVDGAAMTQLISVLARHKTVIDGTFAVWVTSAGTGIGQAVGAGVSNDAQKADANYMRLLKRLYDAGVPLVAGTDAFGSSSYNTELELYEKVGIPAPVVLQIATIVAARVMKDEQNFGSIAVGKVADLFIVDGKPAEHVTALRNVDRVIRAGRLYDARELRTASGLASTP